MISLQKVLATVFCLIVSIVATQNCNAQSIVGKWKGVSVKNCFGAEYAKLKGHPMEEKTAKDLGNSAIEYKLDHTFIMTFSGVGDPEVTTVHGTWSSAADRLHYTLEPAYNPRHTTTDATFVVTGNTLVTTAVMEPSSRIVKTVSTSIKM